MPSVRHLPLLVGCCLWFGCKGSPSVPAPWEEWGAPKEHLIEVGTANADAFYGVYDQDPRGVIMAFREGLAKGGFVPCGSIGHDDNNGAYWSFFRGRDTLWILEVNKNGERSPFNLTKYAGVTSDRLTASSCIAEPPVATPVDAGVDAPEPDAAVVDAAVRSAADSSPPKATTDRVAKSKASRAPMVTVTGGLTRDVVQSHVGRRLPSVRMCREKGMRANPTLAGRVVVKLVVDATGAVTSASDNGSDLPDKEVVACVVRSLEKITFPAPDGGKVTTIVFPFTFAP